MILKIQGFRNRTPCSISYFLKFQSPASNVSFGAFGTFTKKVIPVCRSISATEVMFAEGFPLG